MIEFEHTLFILLLLSSVLNAKPPQPRWAAVTILIGVLLAFIPPATTLQIPWEIILGLTLPLLLWQNIRRIMKADWHGWKSLLLWGATMLIMAAALWLGGALNLPGALLLGIIVASMIWRASESESQSSYMSLIGSIAIIFLLIEVEAAIQSPNRYLGGIFSGMFFGVVFASLAIYLIRKVPHRWHSWIGIGQVYLAYWVSYLAGVSAVSAALVSVIVYIWLNRYFQREVQQLPLPAPLNSWPGFIGILSLFLLLGWESHQPLSSLILLEVLFGTVVGLLITWFGVRWKIPAFQTKGSIWLTGVRISALLLPTLLIWPRNLINEPLQLAVAIGISILVIGFSFLGLEFYFPDRSKHHHHHHQ